MIKREANFGTLFRHWLKANPLFYSAAIELKQVRGTSMPFSAVKDHQLDALVAATTTEGILYKIPDDSRGVKPFDMVYLKNSEGYVIIKYPGFFVIIKVHTFIHEKAMSSRKSLTIERAKNIASIVVDL